MTKGRITVRNLENESQDNWMNFRYVKEIKGWFTNTLLAIAFLTTLTIVKVSIRYLSKIPNYAIPGIIGQTQKKIKLSVKIPCLLPAKAVSCFMSTPEDSLNYYHLRRCTFFRSGIVLGKVTKIDLRIIYVFFFFPLIRLEPARIYIVRGFKIKSVSAVNDMNTWIPE